jgi:hypothetical protein
MFNPPQTTTQPFYYNLNGSSISGFGNGTHNSGFGSGTHTSGFGNGMQNSYSGFGNNNRTDTCLASGPSGFANSCQNKDNTAKEPYMRIKELQ